MASANETQKAAAIKSFQEKLNGTLAPTIRPDKDEIGSILRRNEVYGQLKDGDFDFLEPKICDDFTIADLSAGATGIQKTERLYQDIKAPGSKNRNPPVNSIQYQQFQIA